MYHFISSDRVRDRESLLKKNLLTFLVHVEKGSQQMHVNTLAILLSIYQLGFKIKNKRSFFMRPK